MIPAMELVVSALRREGFDALCAVRLLPDAEGRHLQSVAVRKQLLQAPQRLDDVGHGLRADGVLAERQVVHDVVTGPHRTVPLAVRHGYRDAEVAIDRDEHAGEVAFPEGNAVGVLVFGQVLGRERESPEGARSEHTDATLEWLGLE